MVTSWLVRLALVLTLLGVSAFEGISITVAQVSVGDDAQSAAEAASTAFRQQNNVNFALAAAQQSLPSADTLVPGSFHVLTDGTVSLRLQRTARSLFLRVFKQTRSWTVVSAGATARTVS